MVINEKEVENIIIPIPYEYFIILAPNVIIIFFTMILIAFYIRQSENIKEEMMNNDIHSTSSLPNIYLNFYQTPLSNRTKSLMNFS